MVARGAGAAGPVLLACRQWDPLGLPRRLPSLGVGTWRSAPLLPWRVQCPVCVCAALAAGSGGSGRYLVLCLSLFPHPAPLRVAGRPVRVSLILARWYAIPRGLCVPRARSGCPFGGPCVPFACVCARAPAASAPPPLGGVAWAPRAIPALGAGRAVPRGLCPSACLAPVPCSVWRAWGGAVRSRFPPTWLLLRGASEVRRSPSPDCPPTGRADGVRYPRAVGAGVWVWGPNTVPLACMPCGGWVPRGWCGGGASPGGVACHGVGRSPTPDCPPSGRAAGAHYPLAVGAGGCEHGDPSPTPQLALLRAGFARCGGGMRVPWGGASCLGVGRPGSGALPTSTARPLGGLPGPTTHWLWVRGAAGVGTRHQPHSARSCELALRAEGAA